VHIIAALLYLLVKKQNLITPMLTGVKRVDAPDAKQKPLWLALILLSVSGAAVWALIAFWPVSA
jgi:hypothetical protein